MKKNNPQTPILIREAQGTLPKIYARYGTNYAPFPSLKVSAATPTFEQAIPEPRENLLS